MRFEDKRILRQAMCDLGIGKDRMGRFEFAEAQAAFTAAAWLLSRLAQNVRLNEVSEEEEKDPYVLRA